MDFYIDIHLLCRLLMDPSFLFRFYSCQSDEILYLQDLIIFEF